MLASEGGSTALEGILKANPKAFKAAGLDAESFIAGIRAKEETEKKQQEFENSLALKRTGSDNDKDVSSIDNWVDLLSTGQVGLSQVPIAIRNDVVNRAAEVGTQIVSPTFAGKRADAVQSFNSANSLLDLIGGQSLKVITAKNALSRIPQMFKLSAGAFLQTNPDAKTYQATRDAFLSMLTRAAGEKGVLTDRDVGRIKSALPDFNDTREVAEKKLENLRNLFAGIRSGSFEAYSGTITNKQNTDNDPLKIR